MRVMQCMAGAKFGGAEAFFTRLVLAMHRAGLDQRVVLRHQPGREKQLAGVARGQRVHPPSASGHSPGALAVRP